MRVFTGTTPNGLRNMLVKSECIKLLNHQATWSDQLTMKDRHAHRAQLGIITNTIVDLKTRVIVENGEPLVWVDPDAATPPIGMFTPPT